MDPYKILKVSKEASDSEIKKQYRKLAAKYHPDKGGDEASFKELNEAYSSINTSQKRQEYEKSQHFGDFGSIFGDFGSIFEGFFGQGSHPTSHTRTAAQETTDDQIMFDIRISLEQLKAGTSQTIRFNRNKVCDPCSGIGGTGRQNCTTCSGSGVQVIRLGPILQQTTCRDCFGHGHQFASICQHCSGHGIVKTEEFIDFTIKQKT